MTMVDAPPTTEIDVVVLEQARDLFRDNPESHTKFAIGRDKFGGETMHNRDDCVQWCAIGALYRYGLPMDWLLSRSGQWAKDMMGRLAHFAHKRYGLPSIILVNDELGCDEVVNVFNDYLEWRGDHAATDKPEGYDTSAMMQMHASF